MQPLSLCPPAEMLERFLAGALPSDEEGSLAAHLDACPTCQAHLDRLTSPPRPSTASRALPTHRDPLSMQVFLQQLKALGGPPGLPSRPRPRSGPTKLPEVPGYEVLDEIGRGGMGVVYKARHRVLGRLVALKMILAGCYPTESDRQRFRAEAETIARLQHPQIVQLFEVGEVGGQPFLALEYVAGGTLQQKIGDRPQQPRAAAALVEQLARAIHAAHRQHVVHRDLKPSNVLLTADSSGPAENWHPKITDFGLAKRLDASDVSLTRAVSGTPGYMAPEQIPAEIAPSEAAGKPIGPATDVYALGAILYQMLTGRPPFLGPDWMTTLLQAARRDPVPPRVLVNVPRDLEIIVLKCLAKEPARRYATAEQLADDLRAFQEHRPIAARPVGPWERGWKWARRYPLLAAAMMTAWLTTLSTFIGLGLALWAMQARQEAERRANDGLRERERQANLVREREELLRQRAERSLYLSRMAQVDLLWREADLARARLTLEESPPEQRGWEWAYHNRLGADGLLVMTAPPGETVHAIAAGKKRLAAACFATGVPGRLPPPAVINLWTHRGKKAARLTLPGPALPNAVAFRPHHRLTTLAQSIREPDSAFACVWEVPESRDLVPIDPRKVLRVSARAVQSPDGRWLLVPAGDQVRLIDLDEKHTEAVWKGPSPVAVAWRNNGEELALADGRALTRLATKSGREIGCWPAPRWACLAYSTDGKHLAGLDAETGLVSIRTVKTGREVASWQPDVVSPLGSASAQLRFTPSNRFLVLQHQGRVLVWDSVKRRQRGLIGHRGAVLAVALAPDGVTAATGGEDATVRLWDLSTGQEWEHRRGVYRGHAGAVVALQFLDAGQRLLSGGIDGSLRLWDLTRPQTALDILISDEPPSIVPFGTRDGRLLEVCPGRVTWRNPQTGGVVAMRCWPSDASAIAAYAPLTGQLIDVASDSTTVRVWETAAAFHESRPAIVKHERRGHKYPVRAITVSPDGCYLVTGSAALLANAASLVTATGEVIVWNDRGAIVQRQEATNLCVTALAISADASHLAIATGWPDWDRGQDAPPPAFLRVTDVLGRRPPVTLASAPRGGGAFTSLAFHPNNRQLAVVGPKPDTVQLWHLDESTGHELLWEAKESLPITDLAFLPDGSRLGTMLSNGTAVLRDPVTGHETLRLLAVSEPPSGATFTPRLVFVDQGGSAVLATTRWPGAVSLWSGSFDVKTDRPGWQEAADARSFLWLIRRWHECRHEPFAAGFYSAQLDAREPGNPSEYAERGRVRWLQQRWSDAWTDYCSAMRQ